MTLATFTTTSQPSKYVRAAQEQVLCVSVDHLELHPHNMRKRFVESEIAGIAKTMRSRIENGETPNIIPLRVVKSHRAGFFKVEEGNKRVIAARSIERCPPLLCHLVSDSESKQMVNMVIIETHRSGVDPISKALHFQRMIGQGYTAQRISDETGVSRKSVENFLLLLKLDAEIQRLIGEGNLSHDPRVARALLGIPNAPARLANHHDTIKACVSACEKLAKRLKEKNSPRSETRSSAAPALEFAEKKAHRQANPSIAADWSDVRVAAQAMCNACDLKEASLSSVAEPGWELISHAAEETCRRCNVRALGVCRECPGVELLRTLLERSVPQP